MWAVAVRRKTESVVAVSTCTIATATISAATPPPFTDAFRDAALALEPEFGESHRTLVRVYGTEVAREVEVGVVQGGFFSLSELTLQTIRSTQADGRSGFADMLLGAIGIQVNGAYDEYTDTGGSIRNSLRRSVRYGIAHAGSDTFGDWFSREHSNDVRRLPPAACPPCAMSRRLWCTLLLRRSPATVLLPVHARAAHMHAHLHAYVLGTWPDNTASRMWRRCLQK